MMMPLLWRSRGRGGGDWSRGGSRHLKQLGLSVSDDLEYLSSPSAKPRARRACALRALGLLLADGTPTVGGGKTF